MHHNRPMYKSDILLKIQSENQCGFLKLYIYLKK